MTLDKGASRSSPSDRYRFARFVVVGGVAAVVNILSRIALSLTMSYELAIVVAYACGMTTAYVLNKLFVFSPSGRRIHQEYSALHDRQSARRGAGLDRERRACFLSSFPPSVSPGTRRRSRM